MRLSYVTPQMHKAHHSRNKRETDFELFEQLFFLRTDSRQLIRRNRNSETHYGLDGFDSRNGKRCEALLKMNRL